MSNGVKKWKSEKINKKSSILQLEYFDDPEYGDFARSHDANNWSFELGYHFLQTQQKNH